MIRAMRRWLVLLLMVALLPLRGWVGEAVAGQVLAQQLAAIESVAADPGSVRAAGRLSSESTAHPADCAGHAAMQTTAAGQGTSGTETGAETAGHTTCSQCQMCASLAHFVPALPALPEAVPHAVPPGGQAQFASALALRALKPPIS